MKAYVPGGSRGIGRAVADALIARGDDVVAGSRAYGNVSDDPAALVDKAAAELGRLDVFVNRAVEPIRKPILELADEE
jgi:2-deoxy-D-gluconate 3-dehydrogenase